MKEQEIYQQVLQVFSENVEAVLRGDLDSYKSMIINADDAYDVIKAHGLDEDGEIEHNGWQMDFWQPVIDEKTDKRYILAGSGWYGGVSFYPEK